jgi:hypothetical protein
MAMVNFLRKWPVRKISLGVRLGSQCKRLCNSNAGNGGRASEGAVITHAIGNKSLAHLSDLGIAAEPTRRRLRRAFSCRHYAKLPSAELPTT